MERFSEPVTLKTLLAVALAMLVLPAGLGALAAVAVLEQLGEGGSPGTARQPHIEID